MGVAPTILVSSRDNAPAPYVANAVALVKAAEAHGWTVRQTYALADVPERRHANGNLAKAAHRYASVIVRMHRGGNSCAFGAWYHEGGGQGPGWRYDFGFVATPAGFATLGAKALLAAVAVKP